jgi:hypothetical protein
MKHSLRSPGRQSQEGSVAVEAAICIAFVLAPLILFIFFFGRFFWHYTVVQKAVHDATLYMAKAPLEEVRSGAAAQLAISIIQRETADLDSGTRLEPWSQCGYRVNSSSFFMGYGSCDRASAVPFAVQTNAFMTVPNPFYFKGGGDSEIRFFFVTTMRHAGN